MFSSSVLNVLLSEVLRVEDCVDQSAIRFMATTPSHILRLFLSAMGAGKKNNPSALQITFQFHRSVTSISWTLTFDYHYIILRKNIREQHRWAFFHHSWLASPLQTLCHRRASPRVDMRVESEKDFGSIWCASLLDGMNSPEIHSGYTLSATH